MSLLYSLSWEVLVTSCLQPFAQGQAAILMLPQRAKGMKQGQKILGPYALVLLCCGYYVPGQKIKPHHALAFLFLQDKGDNPHCPCLTSNSGL